MADARFALVAGLAHRWMLLMVSAAVPVFRTCATSGDVAPTFTLPKLSEAGFSAIVGAAGAATVKGWRATVWKPWPGLPASGVKKPARMVVELPEPKEAPLASSWLPYQATAQV